MKKILIIASIILAGFQETGLHAQMVINIRNTNEVEKKEPIDQVVFAVQYQTSFVPDTLKPDKTIDETMMLKVGKQHSVYYSYARFLADSVADDLQKKNAGIETIAEQMRQYQSMISYKIYKNYPSGKVTTLEPVAMNRYRCEEANEAQQWELLSDTATILTYPCRKAVCRFRGRTWTAWYTPEIARSEGPWKLHGLPGLILRAEDSQKHYTFECSGIILGQDGETIDFGANGYEPVSRKDLNKIHTRNAADPVGFAKASAPNVTITIKGEDGQPIKNPKNTPHNPIERE